MSIGMTKSMFSADRFTATQHSTADEKARFCNCFVRFVLGGFARSVFKSQFYRRLSQHLRSRRPLRRDRLLRGLVLHPRATAPFHPVHLRMGADGRSQVLLGGRGAGVEVMGSGERRSHRGGHCREREEIHRGFGSGIATPCRPPTKTHQRFTVVAKSSNTNAFGHRQYVMVADDGSAFKVQRSYSILGNTGRS